MPVTPSNVFELIVMNGGKWRKTCSRGEMMMRMRAKRKRMAMMMSKSKKMDLLLTHRQAETADEILQRAAGKVLIRILLTEMMTEVMIETILKLPMSKSLDAKPTKSLFLLFQLSHTWTIGWLNALRTFSARVRIPTKRSG